MTVNFDSMVEMPRQTIALYLKHIARVSKAFYHINRREGTHALLKPNIYKYMLKSSTNLLSTWKLTHSANAPLHWRAPPRGSKLANATKFTERYIEQFLRACEMRSRSVCASVCDLLDWRLRACEGGRGAN